MKYKPKYPLNTISEIYKTKGETFKGSLGNCGKTIQQLMGFTLLVLRDLDYLMIATQYEELIERGYKEFQEQQFKEMYGEEYK